MIDLGVRFWTEGARRLSILMVCVESSSACFALGGEHACCMGSWGDLIATLVLGTRLAMALMKTWEGSRSCRFLNQMKGHPQKRGLG